MSGDLKKKCIRVLQVIPKLGTGGAERIVLDLAKNLDKKIFEVAILSLYPYSGEPFEKEAAVSGIRTFYLNKKKGLDANIFFQIMRLFQSYRPMVVHNHLYLLYTLLPAFIAYHTAARIHTIHSLGSKESSCMRRSLHKFAFCNMRVVPVSISQIVLSSVSNLYGSIDSPVIYNGIDTIKYSISKDQREKWRANNGISEKTITFVHVARFSPVKNHLVLIEAFSHVVHHNPETVLLLAGDGELQKEIRKVVNAKGLQNNVRFLGVRTDVVNILNASDCFLLSSDWEGLPVSILEAMAVGKPVIATAVGGVPELITNYKNGVLVSPGNSQELATAIIGFCNNLGGAKKMGEISRQIAAQRFDVREMAFHYSELYLRLLKNDTDYSKSQRERALA